MSLIEWSSDYEIGIGVIDGQHRRIIDYINDLDQASRTEDQTVVKRVMEDVVDYTFSHFEFEEALMEEAGYDALSIHQKSHRAFQDKITDFKKRFEAGEDVAQALAELLNSWLIHHIMHDDITYAPLVREKMPSIEQQSEGNWIRQTIKRFFS